MTRRPTLLQQIARDSYRVSRAAGDASAFQRGGLPRLGKRVVRRAATRAVFNLLRNGNR